MKGRDNLRIHLLLIIGLPICAAAGGFELSRALSGHDIAWVYTVEWPLFGVFGVYMWWQLYREQKAEARTRAASMNAPGASGDAEDHALAPNTGSSSAATSAGATRAGADEGLVAWQRYLSDLHAADPPGRPPGT
jgi:hypothetical protein